MSSNQVNFGKGEGTIGGPNTRAVMIEQNRVLLQRLKNDDVWVLPGGGPLFGETTEDAIKRQIYRKGGFEIQVERLLWIMELFFVFRGKEGTLNIRQGAKVHGIGFYYLVSPKIPKGKWQKSEFPADDRPDRLFKWFKLDELSDVNLKPDCLKNMLNHLPHYPEHIIHRVD